MSEKILNDNELQRIAGGSGTTVEPGKWYKGTTLSRPMGGSMHRVVEYYYCKNEIGSGKFMFAHYRSTTDSTIGSGVAYLGDEELDFAMCSGFTPCDPPVGL